jgi:hypothetical protein
LVCHWPTRLDRGLREALGRWRAPRAVHDLGKIVADLAMAVALGGDCLADIAVLRAQPELADPVASDPVISRLVTALGGDAPRAVKAIRAARAAARERAWALAARPRRARTAPATPNKPIHVISPAAVRFALARSLPATEHPRRYAGRCRSPILGVWVSRVVR